jgi:hypothetical protein
MRRIAPLRKHGIALGWLHPDPGLAAHHCVLHRTRDDRVPRNQTTR